MSSFILEKSLGSYLGEGAWHDEASETKLYNIELRIEKRPDGKFQQWFKHVFYQENNSVIEQTLVFDLKLNGIFALTLAMGQHSLSGRGYASPESCHYFLPLPNNLVEVNQHFLTGGKIRAYGSSEKNSQGHYIWWEENMRRSP